MFSVKCEFPFDMRCIFKPIRPIQRFMRFQGIATVSTSVNLTALPTIEEQATITKQDEDADHKHKSIAEVFPQQQQKEATQQQQAWLPDF